MIRYADPDGFAELAVTTNFSFLRGASHPEELVAQAITLGLDAIGIADRNSLAGVVRAHLFLRHNKEAADGLRVLPGTRLVFCDGTPDILAYPQDRAAWGRLCRLLTTRQHPRREGHVPSDRRRSPRLGRGAEVDRPARLDLRSRRRGAIGGTAFPGVRRGSILLRRNRRFPR